MIFLKKLILIKFSPEIEIKLFSKIFNPYEFLKQENLEYKDINKTKLNLEIKEDYSIPNFEDKKVKKICRRNYRA